MNLKLCVINGSLEIRKKGFAKSSGLQYVSLSVAVQVQQSLVQKYRNVVEWGGEFQGASVGADKMSQVCLTGQYNSMVCTLISPSN